MELLTNEQLEAIRKHTNECNLLESNSMIIGFIDNDYYEDYFEEIKKTMSFVCNDWSNEKENGLYDLSGGKQLKMMTN